MGKKNLIFGSDFGPFGPNLGLQISLVFLLLGVRHCLKLSSYSIPRKTYDPNSRKWQKPHSGPDLGPSSFFIKLVVRHGFKLLSYAI